MLLLLRRPTKTPKQPEARILQILLRLQTVFWSKTSDNRIDQQLGKYNDQLASEKSSLLCKLFGYYNKGWHIVAVLFGFYGFLLDDDIMCIICALCIVYCAVDCALG